jgi:hypothetical protein
LIAPRFILSILLFIVLHGGSEALAQAPDAVAVARREAQLKAAYLLNFLRFVEWPDSQSALPLQVCFAGGRNVHDVLAQDTKPRHAGGRVMQMRLLGSVAPTSESAACDVLFIETVAHGNMATANVDLHEPRPFVLTISDSTGFTERGGVIEVFKEDGRLRFSVNLDNARRAGLRVGSSLLQLATVVQGRGP